MKHSILLFTLILYSVIGNAQSDSLKSAYLQVCKTLKEYKYSSQDVASNGGDYAKTIYIKLEIQHGEFLFTFNDDFHPFEDAFYGDRHGIKRIKIPINESQFYYNYRNLYIESENGVEMTYKGKKEILKQYAIHGEELSLKKLQKELLLLQKYAIEEGFIGNLNQNSAVPTPKKVLPQQTEKKTQEEQSQQRTRKRIASGN